MQDRIPVNPGRVLISPENGAAYYATMARADNATQEGTPLNKNSLLKDVTAALFGLGADAVPDDVFAYLGEYAKHWWRRKSIAVLTKYKQTTMSLYAKYGNVDVRLTKTTGDVYYSSEVSVNENTGVVTLVNPVLWPGVSGSRIDDLLGKYVQSKTAFTVNPTSTVITEVLRLANQMSSDSATSTYGIYNNAYFTIVSSESYTVDAGEWSMVSSVDRNAYPDSGESDGFAWVYSGIPFKKLPTMPQIATGSYTGTGTYGASNPNSITFDFEPKIVCLVAQKRTGGNLTNLFIQSSVYPCVVVPFYLMPTEYVRGLGFIANNSKNTYGKRNGNTLYWYCEANSYQYNDAGTEYYYIAIG